MRRAALRALRTARLATSRSHSLRSRSAFQPSNNVLGIRQLSRRAESANKPSPSLKVLQSSMHIRRVSVAVVSGLVGYGAWYAYRGNGTDLTQIPIAGQQARGLSTTSSLPPSETATERARKAVIVGADSLYTGEIRGEGPISKETDESGRKVLEMLTPEQATLKLRRNEESYLVGRGQGVVRYDVVQIPSNDPIEDDHVEKIIELPQGLAGSTPGQNSVSDWMFWGVFDGHSYVLLYHLRKCANLDQLEGGQHLQN